jgi:uncharacterized protein YbaP (TraB family)
MKKIFKLVLIVIISISIIFLCSTLTKTKNTVKGFYWEAKKDNKIVYLIGTYHLGKIEFDYYNENLDYIFDNTQVLAPELSEKDMDTSQLPKEQRDKLYLANGEIKDILNKEEKNQLDDLLKYLNLNYDDISNFSVAGLNSIIYSTYTQSNKLYGEESIDFFIENIYSKAEKKVVSLETQSYQYDILYYGFDDTKILSVDNIKKELRGIEKDINAFTLGNLSHFENNFDNRKGELDSNEYSKIIVKRNKNIAKKIDSFKDDKNYAIALGINHYVGEDSVIKYLENLGYTINRLNKE